MVDLNVMLRDTAKAGLQARLNEAVTNGDTEAATKVAGEMAQLELASQPQKPPYGHAEITAELNKQDWFGKDPKKSARTLELGKSMDPKKFGSAAEFATALVKSVEDELKPTDEEGETGKEEETDEDEETGKPAARKRTDGPRDTDTAGGTHARRASGPWTKLSDAPADVQKEVNRQAAKFAPKTEEGRKKFITMTLESHYNRAQLAKGKK